MQRLVDVFLVVVSGLKYLDTLRRLRMVNSTRVSSSMAPSWKLNITRRI